MTIFLALLITVAAPVKGESVPDTESDDALYTDEIVARAEAFLHGGPGWFTNSLSSSGLSFFGASRYRGSGIWSPVASNQQATEPASGSYYESTAIPFDIGLFSIGGGGVAASAVPKTSETTTHLVTTNATWNGGSSTSNNWNDTANWVNGDQPQGGTANSTINYGAATRTTSNNDYGDDSQFQQILFNSSAPAMTLTGSRIKLFDVSGDGITGKIENNGSAPQTISFNGALGLSLLIESNFEINPTLGNLTINNGVLLDFNNPTISVYGNNGHTLTFNGAISQNTTGSIINQANNVVVFNGANTYSGNTTVLAGELRFGQNGSSNNSTILLGDTAAVANNATITLAGSGQTLTSPMTVRSGNTGTMTLRSENTSGTTNQWNGAITLNKGLTAAAVNSGATLQIGSTFTGNAQTLTIGGTNAGTVSLTGSGDNAALQAVVNSGTLLLAKASSSGVHAIGSSAGVASGLTINAGGTVQLGGTGGDQVFNETNILVNGGTFDINTRSEALGTITMTSGSITGTTGVLTGGSYSLASGSVSAILAGTGSGLTKTGNGTLVLSGTNVYTGATAINAGTLQLGTGGATGSLSTSSAITNSGNLTINRSDAVSQGVDFSGSAITGTGSFTQAGPGTTTLNASNTFSGATTVTAGTLQLSNNLSLQNSPLNTSGGGSLTLNGVTAPTFGALVGSTNLSTFITSGYNSVTSLTLNPAAAASHTYSGVIANGASGMNLNKTGSGTQILSGANTYTGATTVSAGTLRAGVASVADASGAFGLNSAVTMANVSNATLELAGFNTQIGSLSGGGTTGGNITLGGATLTIGGDNTSPSAYGAIISGSGNLTKVGTGTLILSNQNSFAGTTTISGGTLQLGAGGGTGGLTGSSGGIVNNGTLVINRSGINVTNQLGSSLGGVISGSGTLRIDSGNVVFNLANTYTGATIINGGTQQANNAGVAGVSGALGNDSAVTLANTSGTTLNLGQNLRIGSLTGGGAIGGNVQLNGSTLTVGGNNASPSAYAGVISGTGGLTKIGSGNLTLSGANTYSGATTINGGTLQLAASNSLRSGTTAATRTAVALNNGGTLNTGGFSQGSTTSTLGALTLSGNSILTLGTGTGETLAFSDLTTNLSSFTGSLTINNWTGTVGNSSGGDNIFFAGESGFDVGTTYSNVLFDIGGTLYSSRFEAVTGGFEAFAFTPVPEPSTWVAAFLSVGAVGWTQRRRLNALRKSLRAGA